MSQVVPLAEDDDDDGDDDDGDDDDDNDVYNSNHRVSQVVPLAEL